MYALPAMLPFGHRTPRVRRAVIFVPLLVLVASVGCSRHAAPDAAEADATTSSYPATTAAPTTSPTTTETTAPPASDAPQPSAPDGAAFGHSDEELASFRTAYAQAFRAECQRIWASLGGGALADPDFPEDQYVAADCIAEMDESWGEFADSVAEAQSLGLDDAQTAASDLADPLCSVADETLCWSYGG